MRIAPLALISFAVLLTSCATTQGEAEPIHIKKPKRIATQTLRISRGELNRVLSDGPGRFLQRMPVMPHRIKGRFAGFRVLAVYGKSQRPTSRTRGIRVGDVVTAVNGVRIVRPADLMRVWSGLKTARYLKVDIIRRNRHRSIVYPIVGARL
jgi:type II secretory pathway component PulC